MVKYGVMNDDQLKKQIKKSPPNSGIYIFKDSRHKPIYVGKASNLKNRLNSYLRTNDPRIKKMTDSADVLKFIQTESDIEALILESQLIKKFRPQFNIVMRDDKQYFYVGFTDETFPKIFLTHQPTKLVYSSQFTVYRLKTVNSKLETSFIGPFTDGNALKTTLRFLRSVFPYCTCKQLHYNYCLNYHIGKCPGICCLKQQSQIFNLKFSIFKEKEYRENVEAIKDILSGKKSSLIKKLEKEMAQLAKKEELESAIELRDKLKKIKRVFENAKIIGNWKFFRNSKLEIRNLEVKSRKQNVLYGLKQLLKLDRLPIRIEGYDVSNIGGVHAVGSMVTFINGHPNKNFYRKFKIKFTSHHDRSEGSSDKLLGDTGMLKEVLERRFKHSEWPFPDLILVDGGKGQLSAALKVISNFEFLISKQIPIIALTKNKKHIGEKIYISNRKNPLPLTKLSPSDRNLLLHIDSEAHRFAINYYRERHRRLFQMD